MKKFTLMLAGLGIAAATLPATVSAAPAPGYASVQAWQNINARQQRLETRINQGIRSGALSRAEATRVRNEFRALSRLETQYRNSRPGLTVAERRDLDRRFDALSARIRTEKQDRNNRRR
ncbi:hypothetical protein [Sphingomonas sp. M1-B02]|uniref:hypothetical protein n=1 Tax=Sphingomonas sp. M1-B02 TaxID=3114300 RepID=UPI002240379C|nr:hypothetical protein [Sphingomonas sp. S6-11]UZK67617.1 hypothetical protein OKW87_07260 [Sphingomonas sp. S6-11]